MRKRKHGRVRAPGVTSNLHSDQMVAPKVSVENLSLGGAFLRTPMPMPVGSKLEIELARPGLIKRLRVTGEVVSSVSAEEAKSRNAVPGMGVRFDPPEREDEQRLHALLMMLAPSPDALKGDGVEEAAEPPAEPAVPSRTLIMHPNRRAPEPLVPAVAEVVPPSPVLPEHEPSAALPSEPVTVPDSAKLMVQVRGLILEMSDWQSRAQELERENEALRNENEQLKAELKRYTARFD